MTNCLIRRFLSPAQAFKEKGSARYNGRGLGRAGEGTLSSSLPSPVLFFLIFVQEAWVRWPGGSGDAGFKVLHFSTSGHFWFLIESSNLLLNRKWPEVLKSRTSNLPGPRAQVPRSLWGREWFFRARSSFHTSLRARISNKPQTWSDFHVTGSLSWWQMNTGSSVKKEKLDLGLRKSLQTQL